MSSPHATSRIRAVNRYGTKRALPLVAALLAACGPATGGDPEFWAPLPGAGGAPPDPSDSTSVSSSSAGSGGAAAPDSAKLRFQFTTVSFGGEFAPRNIGAVWITDEHDGFIKTLEVWAGKRSKHLVKWQSASGANRVDAVSSATLSSHRAHEASWDGTNVSREAVPDGIYRVYAEFTESNSSEGGNPLGAFTVVEFTRGVADLDMSLPDQTYFTGRRLTFTH